MLGSIKKNDEENCLKWVIAGVDEGFVGKLTFVVEDVVPAHDAQLSGAYLGVIENPMEKPELLKSVSPHLDFNVVHNWIGTECKQHHQCTPDETSELQRFKVIDCETRAVQIAPERCQFVALSYRWGPGGAELPAEQPATIEDAITVTLKLGFRYLWVDKYCIDQSSPMDKHLQIDQMGQIYASAQLTLIAAAGTDPSYGLPGVSRPRTKYQTQTEYPGPVTLVQLMTTTANDICNSTWASRGWTFQEGILSRRRLVFTDQAAVYICATDYLHDLTPGYASGLNYDLLKLSEFISCDRFPREVNLKSNSRFTSALRYVAAYSRRTLGDTNDALNAIIGILNYLSTNKNEPVSHLWGVPLRPRSSHADFWRLEDQYEFALNWAHSSPCKRRPGFPTWSPLGWFGGVDFPIRSRDVREPTQGSYDVRITRAPTGDSYLRLALAHGREVFYSGPNAITSRLEILHPSVAAVRRVEIKRGVWGVRSSVEDYPETDFEVQWDDESLASGSIEQGVNETLIAWRIGVVWKNKYYYLVLKAVGNNIYERVGLVTVMEGRAVICAQRESFWLE